MIDPFFGPMIYATIGMALYAICICTQIDNFDSGWKRTPCTRVQYYAVMFWIIVLLWPALVTGTIVNIIKDLRKGK